MNRLPPPITSPAAVSLWLIAGLTLLAALADPAEADTGMAGKLTMKLGRTKLYTGETTTLSIILATDGSSIRNMQYPTLTAPGISIGEFAPPRQKDSLFEGAPASSYEFTAPLTPRKTGTYRIGPARLSGERLKAAGGAAGFFGAAEAEEVRFSAEPVELTVLPLPTAGRPADFSGAMGRFRMAVSVMPVTAQAGDPLTVTTRISGSGDLGRTDCPQITTAGFKSYPAKVQHFSAALTCTQIVIPLSTAAAALPPNRFTFFNTSTARYETLRSEAIRLTVTQPAPPPVRTAAAAPPQAPPSTTEGNSRPLIWLWLAVPLLLAGTLFRRNSRKTEPPLPATSEAAPPADYRPYLQTAEQALKDHDHDTFYAAFHQILQSVGREPAPLQTAEFQDLSAHCDAVRYGRRTADHAEMEAMLMHIKKYCFMPLD